MSKQLHKRFQKEQVIEILKRYKLKEIKTEHCILLLGISRAQFFNIWKRYQIDPNNFQLVTQRKKAPRALDKKTNKKIIQELKKEKKILQDPKNPVRFYNYSYLKQLLEEKHGIKVSVPTIIDRAKKIIATSNVSRSLTAMIAKS